MSKLFSRFISAVNTFIKNIFIHQYYEIVTDLHEIVEAGMDPDNIGKTGINCHKRPNIAIGSYRALKKKKCAQISSVNYSILHLNFRIAASQIIYG